MRHQLPSEALAKAARARKRSAATAASHGVIVQAQAQVRDILIVDPAGMSEAERTAIKRVAMVEAALLKEHVRQHGSAAGFVDWPQGTQP